jgi:hypothetical protein
MSVRLFFVTWTVMLLSVYWLAPVAWSVREWWKYWGPW